MPRGCRYPKAFMAQVVKAYMQGLSSLTVGKLFGVNCVSVQRWVWEAGYKTRTYTGKRTATGLQQWRKEHPGYMSGSNNHRYKNGLSTSSVSRITKLLLDNAGIDQHTCMNCNKTSLLRFPIHHRDGNIANNVLGNLEVLCQRCHNSSWKFCRHPKKRDKNGKLTKG